MDLAKNTRNKVVVSFLKKQLAYAQQAQNTTAMVTPDKQGYLPLHRALKDGDISLGSIKLLVRAYPGALQVVIKRESFHYTLLAIVLRLIS